MIVPWRVNDGNFLQPLLISDNAETYPFFERGDPTAFEKTFRYSMDRSVFLDKPLMDPINTIRGTIYLVAKGDREDVGNGLIEQDLNYASVPATRTEPASVAFTRQWWRAATGGTQEHGYVYDVNYEIAEQTFTMSGEIVYEYFRDEIPAPLIHPRAFLLWETLQSIGGTPSRSGRIVAEDSVVSIYKGRIYERATPYVKIQPTAPVRSA